MNAITYAISRIRLAIPVDVLNIALKENNYYTNNNYSLDSQLMSNVIRPIVLTDANLVGGIEMVVNIGQCNVNYLTNREFIIDVPKALTNGKSIITPKSLISNVIYSNTTPYTNGSLSPSLSAGINMANNIGTENIVQTSRLELIADNTILVADPSLHLYDAMLRCVIENSDNLENINPRSYPQFAELSILATKAWIYNHTIVSLDKGYIYAGAELSIVKDIIDSYSDAYSEYNEYLHLKWSKIAFMNNSSNTMGRYIKSMISNTI